MRLRTASFSCAALLAALALPAQAHDGHGLAGAHWHATDVWGLLVVGALAALAVWFSRGGK
jgi:hypothetical protein